jgi:potassium/hydrogen antiporter
MSTAVIGLGILFFLGHALNWFFVKTKIPDLLILVIIGYTLGPILGILSAEDFGKSGTLISTLALIVILYEGGLHLSAKDLLTSSLPAAGLSILGFILTGICGFIAAYGFALQTWDVALLIALAIGSTSSAIVIPMVKQLSIQNKTKTILSLESAFTDVLTIVIFLVVVDSIATKTFSVKELLIGIGPNTIQAAFIGIFSALIWAFVKRKLSPILPKAFAGEAWALLTYGVLEYTGLNGAIGVLALGFMLANLNLLPSWMNSLISNEPVSYKEMSLLSEITFLLRTFFFLYLGILIKFSSIKVVLIAVLICLLIFATRFVIIRFLFKPQKYSKLDAMVAVGMGPRGLACAVLATIPLQKGIEGGQWIQDTLFAVIPISILLTAVFVALSENDKMRDRIGVFFSHYENEPKLLKEPEQ